MDGKRQNAQMSGLKKSLPNRTKVGLGGETSYLAPQETPDRCEVNVVAVAVRARLDPRSCLPTHTTTTRETRAREASRSACQEARNLQKLYLQLESAAAASHAKKRHPPQKKNVSIFYREREKRAGGM